MTYIHDTVIKEYLQGKVIQVYRPDEDLWEDLPVYGSKAYIVTFYKDDKYRVKPETKFCFFHTSGNLPYNREIYKLDITMFTYPEYLPSGPHIMIEYVGNDIVKTYHANDGYTGYLNDKR